MESIHLTLDSSTAFQSSSQQYAVTDTPEFYIPNGIQNIIGLKILEVAIPCSWYTITTEIDLGSGQPMNELIFVGYNISPTDISNRLIIPPGNYTGPQLATQLTTLFQSPAFQSIIDNAGPGSTVLSASIVYNTNTNKFTWNFVIDLEFAPGTFLGIQFYGGENLTGGQGRSSMPSILGLSMGGNYFNGGAFIGGEQEWEMTSSSAVLVQGSPYITVNSNKLGNLVKVSQNVDISAGRNNFRFSNQTYNSASLAMIPLSVDQGGILTWQDPERGHPIPIENAFQIQSFDLYLTQGPYYKNPLRLNGLPFTVKLLINTLKNTELTST
jgi:hypothetical protein